MKPPSDYRWKIGDGSPAKRMADMLALHQDALPPDELLYGRHVWISLADGRSDGTAYPTPEEAVNAARAEPTDIFVMRIPHERVPVQACDVLIWQQRKRADMPSYQDPRLRIVINGHGSSFFRGIGQ